MIVIVTWLTFIVASSSIYGPIPRPLLARQSIMLGKLFACQPQRFHCLDWIRERIARPRDAHHGNLRPLRDHFRKVRNRLLGLEHAARHAGPALVHAIVFPVAEVALHVAARRNREMNAPIFIVRLAIETRVLRKIQGRPRRIRSLAIPR